MSQTQLVLCLLGVSAVFFNCVEARLKGEFIVGGDEAAEGQFPYQVSLVRDGKSVCGGSILSEHFVLTAAHCVVDTNNYFMLSPLKVVAGTADLASRTSVVVDVVGVFVPTEYDARMDTRYSRATGDIAMLRLARPLNFNGNARVGRVMLPRTSESYAGWTAIVSGFGWNYVNVAVDPATGGLVEIDGVSYGKMRFAEATVLSYNDCQNIYGRRMPIMRSHLCATVKQRYEDESEGVCSGDSGGPLVYRGSRQQEWIQIGVVSVSPPACAEEKLPAVYTRVTDYLGFIQKVGRGEYDGTMRFTRLQVA